MIHLPTIQGLIRRRLLVNFRVDPDVMQRHLPDRFRPKLQNGYAIAGICLIRLEQVRPKHVPDFIGVASENGAHRVAMRWEEDGQGHEGVFIPRRDTSSLVNHFAGGRLFPGEHHHSRFEVEDDQDRISLKLRSDDGTAVDVLARSASSLPSSSVFDSLDAASSFFEGGSVGFSVTRDEHRLDGIRLQTKSWTVKPLAVEYARSTFFDDPEQFPAGSVAFDCALIMRNVEHEWISEPDLYV
jgi:hypothetical protein